MGQRLDIEPQKLLGFAPDIDDATPGIFKDCNNVIPTLIGFMSAKSPIDAGLSPLSAPMRGAALIKLLNGSARMFAGTASGLYEDVNGTWVDQSATGGYSLGTDGRWRFEQFGNVCLATNGAQPLQASTGTTFSTVPNAPTGQIMFMANGQVFICNCSAPAQVSGGDFWYCSGIYDYTQWDTTKRQYLSNYGQLIDTPGPITGGVALGQNALLFKENSMFIGTNIGGDVVWDFQAVSKEIGALNNDCIVTANNAAFFIGNEDFYVYRVGMSQPEPIGENVRLWFFNKLNPDYKHSISHYYDSDKRVIYWAFASNDSLDGTLDTCLTYNWFTKTWGMMNTTMQGFVTILNGQITYDSLGTRWTAWEDLPNVSWNSSFWINYRTTPGYFDTNNTLQALAGTSTGATITTNAFGDDEFYSSMQQFRIRFKQAPIAGTALWQGKEMLGSSDPSIISNVRTGDLVLSDSRFDVDQSARWHSLILTFTGDFEAIQWVPKMRQQGNK